VATMLPQVPNYLPQGAIDPFGSLLQGAQAGAQLANVEMARQQQAAQMAAMQQRAALEQQAAERAAANEAELQELQAVPFDQMSRQQQLRLLQLTNSEVSRAFISRQLEQIPTTVKANRARSYGGIVNALVLNPEVGVKRLRELAEAETNPQEKKAIEVALRAAEIDPFVAARTIHGMMDMLGGEETRKIADAVVNNLDRVGKPLYPRQPGKPMVVGGAVFFPETGEFKQPPRQSQLLSPEEEAQRARIAAAGRAPSAPREPAAPGAPVAVVDPATGRPVLVTREEALAGRMTPAAAMEGLTPKERQNREAKFPQATTALRTFDASSDTLIKELERLRDHPGLGSITGIAAGRIPGITPSGRAAEALFDKIVARGQFQELQNLRNSSPTGGALGNVSNAENDRLRQAFAALDRRQDAPDVKAAIDIAIGEIRGAKGRLRDAYDLTYEYRQGGGQSPAPAPAPGGGGFPTPPQVAIDALKAGRGTDAQFDAVFGPGAAARARGR
jgi:hypothetical protein